MTATDRSILLGLGLLNFFFVSSYSVIGVQVLFLHKSALFHNLRESIIIGMAIFSSTQVGGAWILGLLHQSLSTSSVLLWCFRLTAALLIIIPSPYTIILGHTFFGLSHAIYYIRSRKLLVNFMDSNSSIGTKGYAIYSVSTNLSFLSIPIIVSYALTVSSINIILSTASVVFALASLIILKKYEAMPFRNAPETATITYKTNELDRYKKIMPFIKDAMRFMAFILPYAIMMALIPIRLSAAGYEAKYNAYVLAANGAIMVAFQLYYLVYGKLDLSLKVYDIVSILSVLLCCVALYSTSIILVPIFAIWTICEAIQLPAIEHHLFSRRRYNGRSLNRILAMDAVACFAGPILAEHIGNIQVVTIKEIITNLAGQ